MPLKTKSKKRTKLKALLDDTRVLLLISFILACIFWVTFASSSTEESTTIIANIPVNIELPEQAVNNGLKVYRGGDTTVSVHIKGNRMTVGSISQADIQVFAQNTSAVTVADTYAISLSAKKIGMKTDYEIVSVSPPVINIMVDKERQQRFAIEKNIDTSGVTFPESKDSSITGYYLSKPTLSAESVTVIGPEQEVKKIAKAQVSDVITGQQSENITQTLDIDLLDSDGEEIKSDLIQISQKTVSSTIQILPEKEVSIIPNFINVPSGVNIDTLVSVKPSLIKIASSQDELKNISSITLDAIDFKSLDPTKTQITCDITLPTGFVNINNETQARVSLNLSKYSSKNFTVSDFDIKSIPAGYTAEVSTSSIPVAIAGESSELNEISDDNIKAVVDLENITNVFEGSQEVNAEVDLSSLKSCWCYNEYTVTVSLKKIVI